MDPGEIARMEDYAAIVPGVELQGWHFQRCRIGVLMWNFDEAEKIFVLLRQGWDEVVEHMSMCGVLQLTDINELSEKDEKDQQGG